MLNKSYLKYTLLSILTSLMSSAPVMAQQMTINNPTGYMAPAGTVGVGAYYHEVRGNNLSDGEANVSVSLTDYLELAYTVDSFGRSSNFGSGGFSAKAGTKVGDNTSLAVGYNQFLTVSNVDKRITDVPLQSIYIAGTHLVSENLALTAGAGMGQFSKNGSPQEVGVFGSAAYRVNQLSGIIEYGQDLAVGASYNIQPNLTVNAAVRDLDTKSKLALSVNYNFKY